MKLPLALFGLSASRSTDLWSPEEDRLWTPDVTEIIGIDLTEGSPSQSWTVPVDGTGRYAHDQYIRVNVNAPELWKITASFENFHLEGKDWSGECTNDAAIIYDGPDGNEKITEYCGSGSKAPVTGTNNVMTLVLKTNEPTISFTGFTVTFTAEPMPDIDAAWFQIVDEMGKLQSMIFDAHAHKKDHIQMKKARHIQMIFQRYAWFRDESLEFCETYAGSGDSNAFVAPYVDTNDKCGSVASFVHALRTFHDAFVCRDNTPFSMADKRPIRVQNRLDRQENFFRKRKFVNMGCN